MSKWPPGYHWMRSHFLKQNRKRHQLFILILTFCVYALYHASRKPLSVVKSTFHKNCPIVPNKEKNWCRWKPFDLDNWSELVGSLEYGHLVCYAIAMFPCGHFAERMDLRLFLTLGMLASGLTTVSFGLGYYLNIHFFAYYFIVQMLGGFAQATGWPVLVTIMSNWFGTKSRGLIMGIWNSNTNFGNMLGSIIAGAFVDKQWGASFIVPGLLLIIGAYIVFLVLVDHPDPGLNLAVSSSRVADISHNRLPSHYLEAKSPANLEAKEQPISFIAAALLPNVMTYALALFFSKLVSYTFLYWLPNYLTSVSGGTVSAEEAAWLSTIFDIGGIFGGILAGLLSDKSSSSESIAVSPQQASIGTIQLRATVCSAMLLVEAPMLFIYQKVAGSMSVLALCTLFVCGGLVTGPCALITTAVSADLGTQPSLQGNSKALATVTAIIDGTGSLGVCVCVRDLLSASYLLEPSKLLVHSCTSVVEVLD